MELWWVRGGFSRLMLRARLALRLGGEQRQIQHMGLNRLKMRIL